MNLRRKAGGRARRLAVPVLGVAVAAGLAGCSSLRGSSPETLFGLLKPYRMEVVQGNVVTQEVMAQIQPGLGRAQVRDILGTPLLTDIFHEDRWDYVFTIARQGVPPQQRRVTIYFKDDAVARFESDPLPSEREFVASITREQSQRKPQPDLTPEQIEKLPVPPRVDTTPRIPQGPIREYPPLEPGSPSPQSPLPSPSLP